MTTDIKDRIRSEIEDLHEFFFGWFRWDLSEDAFDTMFIPRFSADLVFIPPAGQIFGVNELCIMIRSGYASNPKFRVQIRNVKVQREFDGIVMATYEEWQRNALASLPPDNGRIATALFSIGDSLQWLHIHETWLPREIMVKGPFDF